jgi:hypothetical protein
MRISGGLVRASDKLTRTEGKNDRLSVDKPGKDRVANLRVGGRVVPFVIEHGLNAPKMSC